MKRHISLILLILLCLTPVSVPYWIQQAYGAECAEEACSDVGQLARMSPAVLGASSGAAVACTWGSGDSALVSTSPTFNDYTASAHTNNASVTGTKTQACQRIRITSDFLITGFKAYITDANQTGSANMSVASDSSGTVGSEIASSLVTVGNADIPDSTTYGVVNFILGTPYLLEGSVETYYWLCLYESGSSDIKTYDLAVAGGRITLGATYYDNFAYNFAIMGCTQ